jgi:hypothetical protein
MIQFIQSSNDVLALVLRDGLQRTEVDDLLARMDRMLEEHSEIHVFVDIDYLRADDWRTIWSTLPRSLEFLGRLRRFGRVAIVSDDKWVRGMTLAESAILPGISYEVFHAAEADRALRWVEGKVNDPHGAALTVLESDNPLVLAFEVNGTLTRNDLDEAIATYRPRLQRDLGPINVLARIGEIRLSQPTSMITADYLRFKNEVLERVDRYAVVGGPSWLRLMIEATAPLMPFELRHFDPGQESDAWTWVGTHPPTAQTNGGGDIRKEAGSSPVGVANASGHGSSPHGAGPEASIILG